MALLSSLQSQLNVVVPGLPLGDVLLGNVKGFTRGFVFEIIDTSTGRVLQTKSLVMNPRRYHLSEPFTATLTPTQDNSVVAEENGIILREIEIEGTTGMAEKSEDALGRGGSIGTTASGPEHFFRLRDFFRYYSTLKKNPELGPYIKMIFHNIKEDDHFVVIPKEFATPRDAAKNRVHFEYRITLTAIQPLPLPSVATGIWAEVLDAIAAITTAVHDARSLMVEAINVIETYRQRIKDPEAFLEYVALCVNAAHNLVDNVALSIDVGLEFFAATNDLLEDIQEQLGNDIDSDPSDDLLVEERRVRAIRQSLEQIQNQPSKFAKPLGAASTSAFYGAKNLTKHDLDNNLAGADIGTRTRLALGSDRDAGMDLGSFNGSRRGTVGSGDTIDTIATREKVPREAIIELNHLVFPYVTRNGGYGTLSPGDIILIPARTGGASSGHAASGGYMTPDEILYGRDVALDPELLAQGVLEILVDTLHGSTDAQLVGGVPNVVQGIGITLSTEQGTTDLFPDMGMRSIPGTKGTVRNMLVASTSLREAILQDSRVEGIDSMRLLLDGDMLQQEINPRLIGGRKGSPISVPFGKVSQ